MTVAYSNAMLEMVIFSTENSTINNSINFQNVLIKFCSITAKLFRITFYTFKSVGI